MRFPVRVFFRCLSFLLIFFFLLQSFIPVVNAQTTTDSRYQLLQPNVEEDVPHNQHTFIQSIFLEVLLALQCQITGIDLSNPTKSCLGLDLQSGKLGYAPSSPENPGGIQIGGLLGMVNQGIGAMYTPTFSSQEYFKDIAGNFGLVKPTYAAPYNGFDGLGPVLQLWKAIRDIAYYILIIAFIFIGIGVMLRLKIDPRTVMTVQNQIPRVIICIILITFSYAFAGILIDTMWAVTYMGVNRITQAANPRTDCSNESMKLDNTATKYILGDPFAFANQIFGGSGGGSGCADIWGIFDLAKNVANQITVIETNILINFFFGQTASASCGITSLDECPASVLVSVVRWVVSLVWFLIVLIALLIALFKVWFELLKAYIMVLLYVVLAPLWIVFGLLPKRPLGFEKWLRVYFANLAVFPAVVFILVGARVLNQLFDQSTTRFVPPLIGVPSTGSFGAIIEFGMVLMAPQLLSLIREKLSVPPTKQTAAAMQTFNAGRAAAGAPAKQAMKHWRKRDQYGNAIGPLAKMSDNLTNKLTHIPKIGGLVGGLTGHSRNEWVKQNGTARGFDEAQKLYKQSRSHAQKQGKVKEFDAQHKGDVTTFANNVGFRAYGTGQWGGLHPDTVESLTGQKLSDSQRKVAMRQSGTSESDDQTGRDLAEHRIPGAGGPQPEPAPGATPTRQTDIPGESGEGAPSGRSNSILTINIVTPGGGSGAVTIDPSESTVTTHDIVMPQLQSLAPSPERDALIGRIQNEAQDTTSHWNLPPSQLSDAQRTGVSDTIQSINPATRPPGDTA